MIVGWSGLPGCNECTASAHIDSPDTDPLSFRLHAAGAPGTFVRGVNREAGAPRVVDPGNPGTAPATVDERRIDSMNPSCRTGQVATAPQVWEGGPSGAMPLMSPETDLL